MVSKKNAMVRKSEADPSQRLELTTQEKRKRKGRHPTPGPNAEKSTETQTEQTEKRETPKTTVSGAHTTVSLYLSISCLKRTRSRKEWY